MRHSGTLGPFVDDRVTPKCRKATLQIQGSVDTTLPLRRDLSCSGGAILRIARPHPGATSRRPNEFSNFRIHRLTPHQTTAIRAFVVRRVVGLSGPLTFTDRACLSAPHPGFTNGNFDPEGRPGTGCVRRHRVAAS
ncbi:hypothetical protein BN2476_930021 [Paraburkholderia piptadeniae]|uniref:Uncharacterized protein n=1 Tax=Paraburkholderia piptadeniae TaxID=1701573 RepID=A0A1N7STC8_9BURK|nr:hypothetical protein BN2476_930021 [Paraburkholderia piptadeniae]